MRFFLYLSSKVAKIFFLFIIVSVFISMGINEELEANQAEGNPVLSDESIEKLISPILIAHGGGEIYGYRLTNSLEAINSSYEKGFRFMELDFEWTSDRQIAVIHDWNLMAKRMFMGEPKVYNHKEFLETDTYQNLSLMDMDILYKWLLEHPDVYIVTDIKRDNVKMLSLIKEKYGDIQRQLIPQIYYFDEYWKTADLGYENIILTLYKTNADDGEILHFVRENRLFAVAMCAERGLTLLPQKLRERGVPAYVYTINVLAEAEMLMEKQVYGFYTDYFEPDHFIRK